MAATGEGARNQGNSENNFAAAKNMVNWDVKGKPADSGSGDASSAASASRQGGFTIVYYANPGTLRPA